ncbi:MAG: flagellar hook capping FlgD N-terminal domain-containing protein [Acidobacteriaceae bacterium]|nr:flagellar hook capping FlgD N-terminal domain-containing protein [Acidobacteriaceae bacterium]
MSQNVAANFTLPAVLGTLRPASTTAKTSTAKADSSSSNSSDVQTTFLNLLVKELQNQDPTAPMDSTAMVGQMISLNQLDQLISINEALGGATTSTSTAAKASGATAKAAVTAASGATNTQSQAATSQLPFDPNTMMPVGTGANALSTAAMFNLPLNASWAGISNLNQNISGGR